MSIKEYFVVVVMVLSFVSCSKKSDSLQPNLEGKWELESASGGWIGRQTYKQGNGNTLVFKNNTYTQTISYNDTTYKISDTFSVFQGKYCEQSNEQTLIRFGSGQTIPYLFSFAGTKFKVSPPACIMDASSFTYRRIFP